MVQKYNPWHEIEHPKNRWKKTTTTTTTTSKKEEGDDKTTKDPSEIQLWALVDMMVQSKTLIKKNKESKSSE